MKIRKVRVKNFQSLKDLSVDFEEKGVYRFKGLNNTGKSAFLKAMTFLMRNVSNNNYKDYLRDGEDTFSVGMEDYEGNTVTLSRGAIDFYEWNINGEDNRVDKTGGRVPAFLQEYFNLYEENEKTKECLNIRLPREVLLFIDTSPGDNSMMFQKALGTEEYMLAIKKVDKQGKAIQKDVDVIDKYMNKEVEKLDRTKSELVTKQQHLSEIERYEKTLRKDYEEYEKVSNLIDSTKDFVHKQKELESKKDILDGFKFDEVKEEITTLQKIESHKELIQNKEGLENSLKEKSNTLEELDYEGIEKDIKVLKEIERAIKVSTDLVTSKRKLKSKTKELEESKQEMDTFKDELGVCPFCGGSLEKGHVHDGSGNE